MPENGIKRILLNYDYTAGPGTTAAYIERALKDDPAYAVFRIGEHRIPCVDIHLNIEPCNFIIHYPGKKSAYWEIDNHIHRGTDIQKYNAVDYLFVAQKHFLPLYPKDKTTWLPLAADPEIHKKYVLEKIQFDIGFLGNDTYPKRRELLEKINQKYKLLWSTSKSGEEYSRLLSRCKILFNCAMDNDMNMRFFEAMSIGRLLLSDKVDGQDDLFADGKQYVSYKDWEDLDNKIEYYLKNQREREIIAKNGKAYVHSFHTYADRVNKIFEKMGEY